MKIKEIREMNKQQLQVFVEEKRAEAVKLRFDIASKQAKNNREYRATRKDIAKALTVLNSLEK